MAACIAKCTGHDSCRVKQEHRLGSVSATGEANTWRTFSTAHVNRDGSGYISVERDGKILRRYDFPAET